LYILII